MTIKSDILQNLTTYAVQIEEITKYDTTNGLQYWNGAAWIPVPTGGAVSLTSNVITTTDNLGFNLTTTPNPITGTGVVSLTTPSVATLRTAANIGNVANLNLDSNIGNYLRGDGTWGPAAGGGAVSLTSNVITTTDNLGFNLTTTPDPITGTGVVSLTTPSATTLRTAANIGNVANLNLDGNVGNVLSGNGTWIAAPTGGGAGIMPNPFPSGANSANIPIGAIVSAAVWDTTGGNGYSNPISGNIGAGQTVTANTQYELRPTYAASTGVGSSIRIWAGTWICLGGFQTPGIVGSQTQPWNTHGLWQRIA